MTVNPEEQPYEDLIAGLQAGLEEAQRCRHILELLDGTPRRRSQLKAQLDDMADEDLEACLRALQREALIDRRTDARDAPVVHWYELSPLGQQVLSSIDEQSTRSQGQE